MANNNKNNGNDQNRGQSNAMNGSNGTHWFDEVRHRNNKHKTLSKFARLIYYRLIVPIKREKRGPHVIAWGVAIGLFVGFTPTVGFQIPLIIILWGIARKLNFHFSMLLAIAWSWLSNGLTMIPFYYVFYVTGLAMLPDDGNSLTFDGFSDYIEDGVEHADSMADYLAFVGQMVGDIGLTVIIGCLPYAIGLSVAGYWATLSMLRSYKKYRQSHE